jgi:hypothetical protein
MTPLIGRAAIERAEKVAERLEMQRLDRLEERKQLEEFQAALIEGTSWRRPGSSSVTSWSDGFGEKKDRLRKYVFTEAQLEIARRFLDAGGSV